MRVCGAGTHPAPHAQHTRGKADHAPPMMTHGAVQLAYPPRAAPGEGPLGGLLIAHTLRRTYTRTHAHTAAQTP